MPDGVAVDIGRVGEEVVFVLVNTGFGGTELARYELGDEICRVVMPLSRVKELLGLT